MQDSIQVAAAKDGLSLKAYRSDGWVLLAFDLDQHLTSNLVGFAVQYTPPNGPAAYLFNRLSFDTPVTATTTPQARPLTPFVFTGSSNLVEGGETMNGDNLLCITDRATAIAYAVEAIRLVDHYHFRAILQSATNEQPLILQTNNVNWWAPYYDMTNIKYHDRTLFSR